MESYTLHFIIFSKFFFIYKKFKLEFYCIFLIKNLYNTPSAQIRKICSILSVVELVRLLWQRRE